MNAMDGIKWNRIEIKIMKMGAEEEETFEDWMKENRLKSQYTEIVARKLL